MDIIEIKISQTTLSRLWKETDIFVMFMILLLFNYHKFSSRRFMILESCTILALFLKLQYSRSRQIYKLEFNENELILSYYQYIFFRFTKKINYNFLKINYRYKFYIKGDPTKTFEFKKNSCLIAEIREKYNIGWSKEDISNLNQILVKRELL